MAGICGECTASGGRETARHQRAPWRRDQHRGQKRGDGIGYSGHKHQTGDKVIAIIDNNGYVLAPVPVAPVNETDMVLLPQGLKASPFNMVVVGRSIEPSIHGCHSCTLFL